MKNTQRFTIDFTEDEQARVNRLRTRTEARSKAAVVRDAIDVLAFVLELTKHGGALLVRREGQTEIVRLPGGRHR